MCPCVPGQGRGARERLCHIHLSVAVTKNQTWVEPLGSGVPSVPAGGGGQQGPLPHWLPQCPLSLTFPFSRLCKSHGSSRPIALSPWGSPPRLACKPPRAPPGSQDGSWNQHLPQPPERPPLTLFPLLLPPPPLLFLSSSPALESHEPSLLSFPPRHPHCSPLRPPVLSDHPLPPPPCPLAYFVCPLSSTPQECEPHENLESGVLSKFLVPVSIPGPQPQAGHPLPRAGPH